MYGDIFELWDTHFGISIEHGVLGRNELRDILLNRMQIGYDLANQRSSLVLGMPQFVRHAEELNRKVEDRLNALLASPAPKNKLLFDVDTALLLALRIRPQLLQELGIDWRTASSNGLGEWSGRFGEDWGAPWPRLFPNDLLREDFNNTTTLAYEKWTRARSHALASNEVELPLLSRITRNSTWRSLLSYGLGSEESMLAQSLGADQASIVGYNLNLSQIGSKRSTRSALKIDSDISSLREAVANSGAPRQQTITMTITDVKLVPAGRGTLHDYLVWTIKMKPS